MTTFIDSERTIQMTTLQTLHQETAYRAAGKLVEENKPSTFIGVYLGILQFLILNPQFYSSEVVEDWGNGFVDASVERINDLHGLRTSVLAPAS